MNDLIREKLCDLIARRGLGLCATPERCKQSLAHICRHHPSEEQILVSILELGMVYQILAQASEESWPGLADQLVERLRSERALDASAARWGVDAWALALGKISEEQIRPGTSVELGAGKERHAWETRLLAGVIAGALYGGLLWTFGVTVNWGLRGAWEGAVVGVAVGLVRGVRNLPVSLSPWV